MNRDPFDRLRDGNPIPDDHLPDPPMPVAERIVAARAPRRPLPGWAVAIAAGVAVTLAGGAWLMFVDGGSRPVAGGTDAAPTPTTAAAASTTTSLPPATTVPSPCGTGNPPVGCPGGEFPIYLFVDDDGARAEAGPSLVATMRTTAVLSVSPIPDYPAAVVSFLLAGPTPGEREAMPAMSTAIPAGTEVHGVSIEDGVATVDLSAEFLSGGGSLSMTGRLAQVVYTLTALDGVGGVRFEIDGVPTTVFGGEGVVVDDPATRAGFEDLLPAVMIETPPYWGSAGNPAVVTGTANVFEATVSLALTDGDGRILWEGVTTATCGTGCRGTFEATIPYDVAEAQLGSLIAWEASARDGSRINVREHPVWLVPSGTSTEPTSTTASAATTDPGEEARREAARVAAAVEGRRRIVEMEAAADKARDAAVAAAAAGLEDEAASFEEEDRILQTEIAEIRSSLSPLIEEALASGQGYEQLLGGTCSGDRAPGGVAEQEVGPEVAATRAALFDAAVSCDWEAIEALASSGFTWGFGLEVAPAEMVALLQHEEALGFEPLRYLAGLLDRPSGSVTGEKGPITVWPSAFGVPWTEVPTADREALRPLYGDWDFAFFEESGGYVGYRVGIDAETGDWLFFVAGD